MEIIHRLRVLAVLLTSSSFGSHIIEGSPRCNFPQETFGAQFESWNNVRDWNSLDVNAPIDGRSFIPTLDLRRNQTLEYFGRRMRTYFLAPVTGAYTFKITCDDKCKLNLSTDEKPENVVTLVTIKSYTKYRAWTKKHAAIVNLSKGRSYFLEAIMFQRRGDYHMTVGVELPDGNFKAGEFLGKYLVKYAPAGSYGVAPVGDWGAWSQCSKSCGEGTQTRNRSCLNPPPVFQTPNTTNMDPEMRICYPIKPCSLPSSIIQVRNTSSTSLLVEWQDQWPHELRHFQIIYNRTANEAAQNITVNASQKSVELRGLEVFTQYCVRVVLRTRTGVEKRSPCVYARTDQDVPCSPPTRLVAGNHSSSFGINVAWKALSESCWQGVPRGYFIRLQVNETAPEENKETEELFVWSNSTEALLQDLQPRTTYRLQVAAMTERGAGPYSEPVYVETCRCHRRIFVNWMHTPPLCVKRGEDTPTGLIPNLLHDMLPYACGTCHDNQTTEIIFRERSSTQNMIGSLSERYQLNVPISLKPKLPRVGDGWVFLPVVEVAGFAVLTRKPTGDAYARYLASSVMVRWPAFVMMIVMYLTFGLAVWTVEKYKNPAHFPARFTRGWKEGVWWAFVSMTTVGYGDRYPKSVPGRLLGIACFLMGAIITALFVATLSSSLTVFVFDMAANSERGKKIGVISGSEEQRLSMRITGSKGTTYDTRDKLIQGLNSGELDGTIKDVFTVNALIKDLNDSVFEVSKTVSKPFSYGIELTGEARYLLKDFEEYLREKPFAAFQGSSSTEVPPTVSDHEESIGFFEPGNFIYQGTVKVTGIALLLFAAGGLIYHIIQMKLKEKKRKGQPSNNDPQLTPLEIKEEMRQLLEEFHIRMQRTYYALKIKHRRELLKIREKRTLAAFVAQIRRRNYTLEQQV
ncbi:uncharacterized protein LOC144663223 [Oculina patagonica]